ncbi:MAG: TatD family hydrolase [Prolixibacteraceae bacterium]|jgi:TatD DNase family protein|nr:TatD family hydrolase [Prolixibacteraceae bacterium]
MIIDTHSHIYSEDYNGDMGEVVQRAFDAGVEKILLPNIDSSSIKMMLDLASSRPGSFFPMMGLHPTSVKEDYREEMEVIEYWLNKQKFYAIGEIGIDFYWDDTFRKEQEYTFRRQLQLAKAYNLPVSIHTRNSFEVAMRIVDEENNGSLTGVFHCFTGTADQAKEIIARGFKIGVGGIVTFKNAGIDKMVAQLSPEDILLETDSPYLAPVPNRGKRNESSYIVHILKKVSDIFDIPENDIARITSKNAEQLFKI